MPNDEYLAVLRRGAAAWNAWLAQHHEAPDLSRAGLRGLDLSGFDLSLATCRAPTFGEPIAPIPISPARTSKEGICSRRRSRSGALLYSAHS